PRTGEGFAVQPLGRPFGRRVRSPRAKPWYDPRSGRHRQRDATDRSLAHSLFGAERVEHRRRDRRDLGPRGYERHVMGHKATVELVLDCAEPKRLAKFWRDALDYRD